jgi:hypothetical protein
MAVEPDLHLRRIERRALWVSALTIILAAASGGGTRAVLGVIAGAAIVAMSYTAIRAGVDAMVTSVATSAAAATRATTSWAAVWRLVKFITRFAILGLIAYVMMVRLRAHPIWMLLGASSLVAAAALEAVRAPRARP